MSAPVNANINILVNTSQATAQLRSLQSQIATLNKSIIAGSSSAAAQQASLNRALLDGANASRMWSARIVPMTTATDQFTQALDKGRMSLGQYARYAGSQLPGMSRIFKREFEMMSNVAEQNVKRMQTQYVALGNSASSAAQAMALTPTHLNKHAAAAEMAAQRQMMMNRMIDLGSTKLLNWGKNTQWAGRQLMVGFTLPLGLMGAAAAKAFKEIDKSEISFKRVYGNLETTTAEMERNLDAVKVLGTEYTKYGKSLQSTIELSAKVAATGAQDETLLAATEETIRLATLGLMEYDEALGATIALQTAFGVSNEDLTSTIDFLNVVENETILTMQDMAAAIPRVAPVVKGLGGDVKDLAVFMTAMREGGITAEQGANALKSGLGRLINPTKAAREEMAKYNISIDAITQKNKGDLMATIQDFGTALSALGDFEQQQVLQKVFGTYQYARLGALFKNIVRDSGQAQRTLELTGMSVEDLASISERELGKIEEATSTKFEAAMERLKISIAPIGEIFMKAVMPIIDFVSKIANAFNDLPDGIKSAITIAVAAIAGIGPILLMTIGLFANGIANIAKLVQTLRKFFARLRGDSKLFEYLTVQEQEARMAADGLSGSTERLTGKFLGQQKALERLIQLLGTYSKSLSSIPGTIPMAAGPTGKSGSATAPAPSGPRGFFTPMGRLLPQRKFAKGVTQVQGTGNQDTIPALLTPGESVLTKEATKKYAPFIAAMNAGTLPGFNSGVENLRGTYLTGAAKRINPIAMMQPAAGGNQSSAGVSRSQFGTPTGQALFSAMGKSAMDLATRMGTLAKFSQNALVAFDPLDDLFNKIHTEVNSQLKNSKTIDEAIEKAKPEVKKITSDYIKQKVYSGEMTKIQASRVRVATRLLMNEESTVKRFPLLRAERLDVRGEKVIARTQTEGSGVPASAYRNLPIVAQRELERRNLATPRGFSEYQRSHMVSVGSQPFVPGMLPARVQGAGLSALQKREVERAAQSGRSVAQATVRGADQGFGNASPSVKAQQSVAQYVDGIEVGAKNNSSQAAAAGRVIGNSFSSSVKAAMDQANAAGSSGARPMKISYSPEAQKTLDNLNNKTITSSGNLFKSTISGIFKEVGNIFRILPQLGYELLRNIKEPMKILGSIIKQISAPYVKPIVDGFKFLKDTVLINVKTAAALIAMDIKKIPSILRGASDYLVTTVSASLINMGNRIKGAYETVALKTIMALESVKNLPAKIKSSYETAALRLMMGLDSMKKLPETIKRQVSLLQGRFATLREDFSNQARRLANKAFYGQQDIRGRISERFAGIRERFGASAGASAAALREGDPRTAARAFVPDRAAAQVKTMSQQIVNATNTIKNRLTETATNIANSARLAKILLKDGDARGALRAITPDKIAQAFSAATKPIIDASKIAYGKLLDGSRVVETKLRNAAEVAGRKISDASAKLSAAGQNLANSLNVAGRALAAGDPRTALRSLTPDRLAAALGSARSRAGEMLGAARQRVGGIAESARATGITAYNALLERDVKTFIKALTPDRVWKASSNLANTISQAGKSIGVATKFAYDTIIFNAKAAIALGPSIIKDGFIAVRSGLLSGAKFLRDTIAVNVRAALFVGASEIKKAFTFAKTSIAQGGKFILDTVRMNIGAALIVAKAEITRISGILRTEGPKLKMALTQAGQGFVGAIKGAGVVLADSIKSVGSLIRNAGAAAAQGIRGFVSGGVDASGRTRGQRMAGVGNNAMMGMMGVSMAASFLPGEMGELAQKIMPVTMGFMALQMILPMLTRPLGILAFAAGGLAAGFIYLRKQLDDAAKAAAEMGANIGGVANGMKIIEEATGFKAPKQEDRLFRFTDEDREAMGQFGSYFESEAGSKFIQDLREASSEERYQKVSTLLAQGIASGLEKEKAEAFGKAIAEATGDAMLNSNLARDFANQIFDSGSQALIDLENKRNLSRPNIEGITQPYRNLSSEKRTTAVRSVIPELPMWQRILDLNFMPGAENRAISVPRIPILSDIEDMLPQIPGLTTSFTEAAAEIEVTLKPLATGLGFSLQTIKNLANAEAVLEEERRNSLIEFPEYEKRLEDLNKLQQESADYIGQIFAGGADSGAMMEALGDQLSFSGFSEDQIKRVQDTFSPDQLAKQFFGEDEDFASLEKSQQDYIEKVFTSVMSGLTPENISQRLTDIEGTYTNIAQQFIDAVAAGFEGDLDLWFNRENIASFIEERMNGGIAPRVITSSGIIVGEKTPEDIAANIMSVDQDLKRLGTDSMEVFTRLSEFKDIEFAKEVMASKAQILEFGDAVGKLAEYEDIKLEIIMDKGADPGEVLQTLKRIDRMELDPEIFGALTFESGKLVTNLIDAGVEARQIPTLLSNGVTAIESFGKAAVDELGNIKPKIVPDIVARVFDTDATTAGQVANALESAFPDKLNPIDLAIVLSLAGNPQALALLQNPNAVAAAKAGKGVAEYTQVVDGEVVRRAQDVSVLSPLSLTSGGQPLPTEDTTKDKDTSGSGGSTDKEKSALQEMISALNATLKLYGTAKTLTKKVLKSKKEMNKFFKELSFDDGVSDQLRAMNLSETLIADLLSKGVKNVKKIMKALGERGLSRLDKVTTLNIAGQRVEEIQAREEREGYKAIARTRLEKDGSFTKEEIDKILENEQDVEIIAKFPIKKSQDEWKTTKDALQRDARIELTIEPKTDLEKFDDIAKEISDGFDAVEQAARDKSYASFLTNNSKLAESLGKTQKTSIENGYDLVDAINKQIDANERALNIQQDIVDKKQEEINDYQRLNDLVQQNIDNLKRQDELRNRVAEGLSRELEQMSKQEGEIRKAYDERIAALDKVASINDYIVNQQKQQLNLSQALSSGDIYAATAAAQEMRATSAQFATEQVRRGLQEGMENQIAGLRTSGGLTREQAEQEISDIKEQSYQTTLLIRTEEDKIYANNLEVRRLSNEIYNINEDMIEPLQNQNKEYSRILDYRSKDEEYAIRAAALAGVTREEWERRAKEIENSLQPTRDLTAALQGVAAAYRDIYRDALLASGATGSLPSTSVPLVTANTNIGGAPTNMDLSGFDFSAFAGVDWSQLNFDMNAGGMVRYATGGSVLGDGTRDSIKAMLTPGEFVIRKAMVDKYGMPMLSALNQGAFTMPKYNMGQSTSGSVNVRSENNTNVVAPMYNNYSVNVSVSNSGASADEIATKAVMKIKQMQNTQIRSGRGY